MIGTHVGQYRLLELLGEGGVGRVYLAEHRLLGSRHAIKLLRAEPGHEPRVRRFIEDTRILRLVGYDATNGRGIYAFDTQDPNIRDHEATRWRMQFGARYTF